MITEVDFATLKGKTFRAVRTINLGSLIVAIHFIGDECYTLMHIQDCCESVWLEDVAGGELSDIEGHEILEVYESVSKTGNNRFGDTETWTFYTIRTMNTTLTLRWCGTSNGYYSESVELVRGLYDEYGCAIENEGAE